MTMSCDTKGISSLSQTTKYASNHPNSFSYNQNIKANKNKAFVQYLYLGKRYTPQIINGKSCMIKFLVRQTSNVFIKRCLKVTNMPSFAFFVVVINDAL